MTTGTVNPFEVFGQNCFFNVARYPVLRAGPAGLYIIPLFQDERIRLESGEYFAYSLTPESCREILERTQRRRVTCQYLRLSIRYGYRKLAGLRLSSLTPTLGFRVCVFS